MWAEPLDAGQLQLWLQLALLQQLWGCVHRRQECCRSRHSTCVQHTSAMGLLLLEAHSSSSSSTAAACRCEAVSPVESWEVGTRPAALARQYACARSSTNTTNTDCTAARPDDGRLAGQAGGRAGVQLDAQAAAAAAAAEQAVARGVLEVSCNTATRLDSASPWDAATSNQKAGCVVVASALLLSTRVGQHRLYQLPE